MGPWKNKIHKNLQLGKNHISFSSLLEVKLSLCSEVTMEDHKPEKDEVGQAMVYILKYIFIKFSKA